MQASCVPQHREKYFPASRSRATARKDAASPGPPARLLHSPIGESLRGTSHMGKRSLNSGAGFSQADVAAPCARSGLRRGRRAVGASGSPAPVTTTGGSPVATAREEEERQGLERFAEGCIVSLRILSFKGWCWLFFTPKGWHSPAQGNALGRGATDPPRRPERAPQFARNETLTRTPFQG